MKPAPADQCVRCGLFSFSSCCYLCGVFGFSYNLIYNGLDVKVKMWLVAPSDLSLIWICCIEMNIECECFIWLVNWNKQQGKKTIQNFINCTYNMARGGIHIIKAQSDGKCDTEKVTQLILVGLSLRKWRWFADCQRMYIQRTCDANQHRFQISNVACDFMVKLSANIYGAQQIELVEKCVQIDNCCSNFLSPHIYKHESKCACLCGLVLFCFAVFVWFIWY